MSDLLNKMRDLAGDFMRLRKDYDEDKHPRSSDGKFTSGGGGENLRSSETRSGRSSEAIDKWHEHPYFKGNSDSRKILSDAFNRGYEIPSDKDLFENAKESMHDLISDDDDVARDWAGATAIRQYENGDIDGAELAGIAHDKLNALSMNSKLMQDEMANELDRDAEGWLDEYRAKNKEKSSETGDLSKEFSEDKHPRGSDGKFSAGEGTQSSVERTVANEGSDLQPQGKWGYYGKNTDRNPAHDDKVEGSSNVRFGSKEIAQDFLNSASGRHLADALHGLKANDPDVFRTVTSAQNAWMRNVVRDAKSMGFKGNIVVRGDFRRAYDHWKKEMASEKSAPIGDIVKEYDEEKHPRGEGGKWTSGAGANSGRPSTIPEEKWQGMTSQERDDARQSFSNVVGRASGAAQGEVGRQDALQGRPARSEAPEYQSGHQEGMQEGQQAWEGVRGEMEAARGESVPSGQSYVDYNGERQWADPVSPEAQSMAEHQDVSPEEAQGHLDTQAERDRGVDLGHDQPAQTLEEKQSALQGHLRNQGVHQSEAMDQVAAMSEEQIDAKLAEMSQDDAGAVQESIHEANYQKDLAQLRDLAPNISNDELNAAIGRMSAGYGKPLAAIRDELNQAQASEEQADDANRDEANAMEQESQSRASRMAEEGRQSEQTYPDDNYPGGVDDSDPEYNPDDEERDRFGEKAASVMGLKKGIQHSTAALRDIMGRINSFPPEQQLTEGQRAELASIINELSGVLAYLKESSNQGKLQKGASQ